jgi:hypothetical protein
MAIRITLRGLGGELDCRVIEDDDVTDQAISDAVKDIALNCVFSVGDVITIEEIEPIKHE